MYYVCIYISSHQAVHQSKKLLFKNNQTDSPKLYICHVTFSHSVGPSSEDMDN